MIEAILQKPWLALAFVVILVLLWLGAARRVRSEQALKRRAPMDRRSVARSEPDRRWRARE